MKIFVSQIPVIRMQYVRRTHQFIVHVNKVLLEMARKEIANKFMKRRKNLVTQVCYISSDEGNP